MDKSEIRRRVKAQKSLLTDKERKDASASVFDRIEALAAFVMSEHILIYHSLADELSTRDFLSKWHKLKRFYLPRVNGVNLDILPYESTSLRSGAFHIEEPIGDDIIDDVVIDLIIAPGIAFDKSGNRVGRGKGFYDRLLSGTKAYKIGVGYDFQLYDEIEPTDYDVPMDMVITESHSIVLRRPRKKKG